jgi:hypothetical protein
MIRCCCSERIGKDGMRRCKNAYEGNCGKGKAEHLNSPVRASGKFIGNNLGGRMRYPYETLHTSEGGPVPAVFCGGFGTASAA